MKTIFMTIYDGAIAKNLLRTDFWKVLKVKNDLRVVLFATPDKAPYYREKFGAKNVFIESLPRDEFNKNIIYRIFTELVLNSIHTNTVKIRQYNRFFISRGNFPKRLILWVLRRIIWYLGALKIWRNFLRFIYKFFASASFAPYFDKYQPDLVFAPNMVSTEDSQILLEAKKRNIKTLGMIKSWDNLTSKTFILVRPDKLIVHNPKIKEEAAKYGDFPVENIFISGIPQYDFYLRKDVILPREDFFRNFNLDPQKKLIFFCAPGDIYAPDDEENIDILHRYFKEGKIQHPVNVLISIHPKYNFKTNSFEDKYSPFVFVRIGTYPKEALSAWEFEDKDIVYLINCLYHSDIVINTASTMTIEACILDRPVISIAFDGRQKKKYWLSTRRYCDLEHYSNLIKAGGVRLAKNPEELLFSINQYLENPTLNRKGRERIAKEQLYKLDGRSGQRIGNFLLEMIA